MKTNTRYPKLQPDREKKKVMVNNDICHELEKPTVDICIIVKILLVSIISFLNFF